MKNSEKALIVFRALLQGIVVVDIMSVSTDTLVTTLGIAYLVLSFFNNGVLIEKAAAKKREQEDAPSLGKK